jgi:hypothetical protein
MKYKVYSELAVLLTSIILEVHPRAIKDSEIVLSPPPEGC